MTFKERLQKEHPDKVDPEFRGGCLMCPITYGYEDRDDVPCHKNSKYKCDDCWNRTIPGTEEPRGDKGEEGDCGMKNICKHVKPAPDLNALIERAGTKKDISLLIHINGNDTTISVYPCPDPSEKKGNPVAEAYKLLVQANLRDENNLVCAVSSAADLLKEALEC